MDDVAVRGVDRALLAEAGRLLGAADDADTVNRALAAAIRLLGGVPPDAGPARRGGPGARGP